MRLRISTLLWIMVLVFGAFGLYMVKYTVQDLKKEVRLTEKNLMEEKKNLHVVKAEWAFLTCPERIRRLAAKYLNVKPMTGKQIAVLGALPYNKQYDEKQKEMASEASPLVKLVGGVERNDDSGDE